MRWLAAIGLVACGRVGFGGGGGVVDSTGIPDGRGADAATPPIDGSGDASTNLAPLQEVTGTVATGGTLTLAFGTAPAVGHLLVMVGGDPQETLTSVTGGGTSWRLAARSNEHRNVEIWYGITDGSSASVTIELANSISPLMASVSEWQGIAVTNALDAANAVAGTTGPASAAIVTTHAHDLIVFGAANERPNVWGMPAPGAWTAMTEITSDGSQQQWYRIVDEAGSVGPHVTQTAAWWDAAIAAFRIE